MYATTISSTIAYSSSSSGRNLNDKYPRLCLISLIQARQCYGYQEEAVLHSNHAQMRSSSKYGSSFLANQGLFLRLCRRVQCKSHTKTDGAVCSSAPSGLPSNSWRNWILGTLISIILPFWTHKWAPLLALKRNVEIVVETIDTVTEVVEKVAESVEKVADEVAERLPEGGKLQQAVCMVEQVAKKIAEDAHAADEFIHKVEEMEEEVEKEVGTIAEAIFINKQENEEKQAEELVLEKNVEKDQKDTMAEAEAASTET